MAVSYRKPPVLAIEDLGLELGMLRGDPIEALARFGAQLVLTSYIEAEVEAHLGAGRYERTMDRQGHRNGHRTRRVTCGLGMIEVEFPKVRHTARPFRSQVLDAWQRTSSAVTSSFASLYIEGLSTRDYERALKPVWRGAGLSRSTVSRANEQIKEAFCRWRRRSLAEEPVCVHRTSRRSDFDAFHRKTEPPNCRKRPRFGLYGLTGDCIRKVG